MSRATANNPMLDLILSQIDRDYPEGQEGMQARLKALPIEWHCPGRHGVIRNVAKKDEQEVLRILTYFFGHKCAWGKGRDLEFVHMTKVSPPPRKPWEWCGTSVLFADWHDRQKADEAAVNDFRLGQHVTFEYKGRHHVGTVSGRGRARLTIVTDDGLKFYMPPSLVTGDILLKVV